MEVMRHRQVELENLYGGTPIGSLPSPLFVDRSAWLPVQDKVRSLRNLLERMAFHLVEDDRFATGLHFSSLHADLVRASTSHGGRPAPLARIDGMIDDHGRFQVVEVNTDGSTGVHDCFALAESARSSAPLRDLCQRWQLEPGSLYAPLAEMFRTLWNEAGREGIPRVAIVDWDSVKSRYEQQVLARRLTDLGIPSVWCDPRQLTHHKGQLQSPEGRVDIIYKRVLTAELLQRREEVTGYLDAILAGTVLQINPFTADILYDKGLLALLQEPAQQALLTPQERDLFQELVPLARFFPGDDALRSFAEEEQATLVLKPRTEYGGRGVVLGNQVEASAWRTALTDAEKAGSHILQRYLEPNIWEAWVPKDSGCEQEKLFATIGLWVMGDEAPGFYFRAGPSPVINVSGGAYGLPVLG
jgi:glutathionylspermidine synthase